MFNDQGRKQCYGIGSGRKGVGSPDWSCHQEVHIFYDTFEQSESENWNMRHQDSLLPSSHSSLLSLLILIDLLTFAQV